MRASMLGPAVTAALAFGSLAFASLPALAQRQPQGDDQRARMHFEAGNSYFQTGEYEAALREFNRSYELSRRAALFYNMALVYERLNDLEQAIAHLERFLAEAPEAEAERAMLEARIGNLRPRLEEQRARAAAEADRARRLEEEERRRAEEERRRAEEERRRAAEEESGGGGLPALTWIGWGVGAAGLATFGVFGVLTLVQAGEMSDGCVILETCEEDDVDDLQLYALLADIGLITGVVGAALGTTVLLLSGGEEEERPAAGAVSLAPWLSPRAGGAALTGTF